MGASLKRMELQQIEIENAQLQGADLRVRTCFCTLALPRKCPRAGESSENDF